MESWRSDKGNDHEIMKPIAVALMIVATLALVPLATCTVLT
jgi:hypothetical protein